MRAGHVMVVADSCYSGTLTRGVRAVPDIAEDRRAWIKRMTGKRARTALASGGLEPVLDAGGGEHSVFAKAFLSALRSNQSVMDGHQLFTKVSRPVALESDQTPRYADIRRAGHEGGDFLFVRTREIEVASTGNAAKRPALAAPSGSDTSADVVFWQSIQDSGNADMFRAYLAKFPNGTFAGLAHLRIEELNKASQAATKSKAETSAAAELVFWTSIKDSDQPKGFREYLQQFPGGTFAELAQLRLAELVKQAALSVPQPAASAASADIDTMESAGGGAQTLQNQLFEKTNVASLPSGVETVDEPGANRGFSGTWLWRVNLDGDTYCGGAQTQSMRITNGKILSGVTLRGSNFVVDGTIRKN